MSPPTADVTPGWLGQIERSLGLERGRLRSGDVRVNSSSEIGSWHYRLGNSQNPTKSETVITIYAKDPDAPIREAYLIFYRDLTSVTPPNLDDGQKRLYVGYGWDQMSQVRELLDLIGKKPVYLVYLAFSDEHKWAELHSAPLT